MLTTSGGTEVGTTRNFSMTVNKGPKNGGPPASGTVYYFFSVNGVNLPPMSQPFSRGRRAEHPGRTPSPASFTIASAGANTVIFRKVIYDIPSFNVRVQCNGQTSGVRRRPEPGDAPGRHQRRQPARSAPPPAPSR